jgi:hypothetical protein
VTEASRRDTPEVVASGYDAAAGNYEQLVKSRQWPSIRWLEKLAANLPVRASAQGFSRTMERLTAHAIHDPNGRHGRLMGRIRRPWQDLTHTARRGHREQHIR